MTLPGESDTPPILVWRFQDAPQHLKDTSPHGGDEDWLAVVPSEVYEREGIPAWAEEGGAFGYCNVSDSLVLPDGQHILIGAHA